MSRIGCRIGNTIERRRKAECTQAALATRDLFNRAASCRNSKQMSAAADAANYPTFAMVDLRPRVALTLKNRWPSHWTPRYLRYRIPAALRAHLRPQEPSLTPRAIKQLESMLRPDHVGVEWGSGNTTRWFAKRTRHLTSFETDPAYYERVAASLTSARIDNADSFSSGRRSHVSSC